MAEGKVVYQGAATDAIPFFNQYVMLSGAGHDNLNSPYIMIAQHQIQYRCVLNFLCSRVCNRTVIILSALQHAVLGAVSVLLFVALSLCIFMLATLKLSHASE